MKKTILSAVAAATAVAALSACTAASSGAGSSNAAGTNSNAGTSSKSSSTKSKAAPSYTTPQQNAIQSAQAYLSMGGGFSRAGLIDQLSSKAGDGFKKATAVFAVNHIKINWKKQAVLSAKAYLKMGSGFSRTGLIDQLSSKAGDQYTLAQATYAANHVGF